MLSVIPEVEALSRDTAPGRCLLCQERLPRREGAGRRRIICKDPDCVRSYQRLYHSAWREKLVGRWRRM